MDLIFDLIQIGIVLALLLLGLSAGRIAERRHFRRLAEREQVHAGKFVVTDLRSFPGGVDPSKSPALVSGEVVISSDYFKTFAAALKKIIGGELRGLETLMHRARREAVLRMMERAAAAGYDSICNVRVEGYDVAGSSQRAKKAMVLVAIQVSGTAYKRAG